MNDNRRCFNSLSIGMLHSLTTAGMACASEGDVDEKLSSTGSMPVVATGLNPRGVGSLCYEGGNSHV